MVAASGWPMLPKEGWGALFAVDGILPDFHGDGVPPTKIVPPPHEGHYRKIGGALHHGVVNRDRISLAPSLAV
jgi:hypothetical protein